MSVSLNVAELKRRFSEILNRIELRGERIGVQRRGRTVAIIVPATEDEAASAVARMPRRGLAAAAGAWEEYPNLMGFVADIRDARDASADRKMEGIE